MGVGTEPPPFELLKRTVMLSWIAVLLQPPPVLQSFARDCFASRELPDKFHTANGHRHGHVSFPIGSSVIHAWLGSRTGGDRIISTSVGHQCWDTHAGATRRSCGTSSDRIFCKTLPTKIGGG